MTSPANTEIWTAGALAGMRLIEQAPAFVGSSGAVPARAPAVHIARAPSSQEEGE